MTKPADRVPERLKREVARRARDRCEYCLTPIWYSSDPFVVEHIRPRSLGGATTLANLALACHGCNGHKYNKTQAIDPESKELVPLYNPREQAWREHFFWSDEKTLLLGKTPTGRATVDDLDLNRSGVVNLRRMLLISREHPPQDTVEDGMETL